MRPLGFWVTHLLCDGPERSPSCYGLLVEGEFGLVVPGFPVREGFAGYERFVRFVGCPDEFDWDVGFDESVGMEFLAGVSAAVVGVVFGEGG